MYTPAHFEVTDRATILSFMQRYNFAALITSVDGNITATHAPLVIREDSAGITLIGHVAKANVHGGVLTSGAETLIIFMGPHAYISPSLYESKLAVPTWNYTAVHAYGNGQPTDPVPALLALIDTMEPAYRRQWDELPEQFRQKMIGGITAFEIRVTRLEAKFKLSQNRPVADRSRVIDSFAGAELGEFMKGQL